ncbi:ABC transporter protein [Favolaschia claudopus]|uniref:ABC transporter protein n=1 Tax=Favolaschia claudopus TaxID=2862362 RepID=A0AAW0ACX9_9AGAR
MQPPATILQCFLTLILLRRVLAHPLNPEMNAGLGDGLGGLLGNEDDNSPVPIDQETNTVLPKHPHIPTIVPQGLGGLLPTALILTQSSSIHTTIVSSSHSVSISMALASVQTTTPFRITASSSSAATLPSSTTAATPTEAAKSPPETNHWKAIGIGALTIGLVAGLMLSLVFFDSWWGFLRALVGKKRQDGTEDLVPDWANRDWEFKVASTDSHRYPTLASLESTTKNQGFPSPLMPSLPDSHEIAPTRPLSLHLSAADADPHPLEPIFRRPSASTRPIPRALIFQT